VAFEEVGGLFQLNELGGVALRGKVADSGIRELGPAVAGHAVPLPDDQEDGIVGPSRAASDEGEKARSCSALSASSSPSMNRSKGARSEPSRDWYIWMARPKKRPKFCSIWL